MLTTARIAASICITSILIGAICAFVLIWGPSVRVIENLFTSCIVVFLASASILSISTTLRIRGPGVADER